MSLRGRVLALLLAGLAPVVPAATAATAATVADAWVSLAPGATFKECEECPGMVVIPPGSVRMGFDGGERDRYEGPVREVVIPRSFAVGRYELTQGQYAAFVKATGYEGTRGCNVWDGAAQRLRRDPATSWRDPGYGRPPQDNEPVACVSWNDAKAYVAWVAQRTGHPYRLLTEAEWEYVARAGSSSRFPWGEDPEQACRHANVYDASAAVPVIPWPATKCSDGYPGVAPIARFPPNAFGLYDVIGNVWEWVEDCYAMPYPATPVDGSAQLAAGCDRRAVRGGGWRTDVQRQRPSFRGRDPDVLLSQIFGFRVARDLAGAAPGSR
jgi:formylglycine-generating enzyme required for sulfatase activity